MSISLFLVMMLVVMVVKGQQGCSLDGYDLTTLQKQTYWQVTVAGSDCHHYYQGGSCIVYFSVCGELPEQLCGGPAAAVCQVAVSEDGRNRSSLILGTTANRSLSSRNDLGFRERFLDGGVSNVCNTSVTTDIVYTCDATAIWLSGAISPNIHLVRFTLIGCQAYLELRYNGACYESGPLPSSCNYTGSYDITTLTSRDMWYVQVQSLAMCYPSTAQLSPCVLLLSFCRSLPRGACNNSTFCQATPGISLRVFSFGTYRPEVQLQTNVNSDGFTISNTGGLVTTACPSGHSSAVVFQCDTKARWEELLDGNITRHVRSIEPNTAQCMITLTVGYSGACQSSLALSSIIAGSVVGAVVLLVSLVVGIIIVAVTYRHIHRKYGGYTRVGVYASDEERLLFRQTSESNRSEDETRSPPSQPPPLSSPPLSSPPQLSQPINNGDEERPSAFPHSAVADSNKEEEEELRMPTLEAYQPK